MPVFQPSSHTAQRLSRCGGPGLVLMVGLSAMPVLAQQPLNRLGILAPAPTSWSQLSAEQQAALKPLAGLWSSLDEPQQRKWVALANQYGRLSAEEQVVVQTRMRDWARLTPAERTQARLNYGEIRQLHAQEKRAKWEEYQALSQEERDRLANARPAFPITAAPALRPTPPDKIVRPVRATIASAPSNPAK